MRLLKAQNTNLRNIYGNGVKYDVDQQVILDSNNSMLISKGTTAQRPGSPSNGHMRYNTDVDEFEFYQDSQWRKVSYKESTAITQQNVGSGDAVETLFGPLDNSDTDFPNPTSAQSVLVFVENVFQISGTNYTLVQNPGARAEVSSIISIGATTVIETATNHGFTTADLVYVSGVESSVDDNLENLNTDDSSSPGSHTIVSVPALNRLEIGVDTVGANISNYTAGTGFILKAGTSTGPYVDGYYLSFTSAPDLDKPITVLHNFDK